ncbi:response regulator [Anaplasma marginale]|uniref:response regulator n=1 Tax=Anaplasma marginale TaxID=770 RepID=UPI0018EA2416|nr:response regulator [Anaplasma marginale]
MKEIKERLANNSAKSIRASERFLREKYPQLSNSPLPTLTRKKPKDTQKRVLVIDDSIVIREMVCMNLKKAGYQVEKAWDGKHAWEILKGGLSYNLIFCDIKMPRMNGLEFLQRLQKMLFYQVFPSQCLLVATMKISR